MSEAPILEITSHIDGKNAKVRVYPDRIEWERGKTVSGGKIAAGLLTAGTSLLATGVHTRKGAGVEVIPMRAITSVTSRRDTAFNDVVSVVTAGNTIDMRCHRNEATRLRGLILDGINGRLVASAEPPQPPPSAGPPPGWYPDRENRQRWWDGSRWTEHVRQ